jgi:hypothetical protein
MIGVISELSFYFFNDIQELNMHFMLETFFFFFFQGDTSGDYKKVLLTLVD